ncbi:ATP phosphoribosyltransferase regulatory subunit [Palleronia sp. KMU-117]|uniref:ATP phosphoribosyltransferase regulatory subunit n=1 Tax=Palleronia sp. KMU-117 TaxID=3434108 RepID=UPI003D7595BE
MPDKAAILAEALRLRAAFEAVGAEVAEADILQPAETLLDLYGEEIRARAYVTHDPARGEAMLRPDFTVPIVQMHMDGDGGAKRYTYMGEVFRKQEDDRARASEYIQVGYEVFNGSDAAQADAEVFAAFAQLLAPLRLRAATGDIGLLTAAVKGLSTSDRRKEALLRHLWRPHRFRALMDRFGGRTPMPPSRRALIEAADPLANAAPEIGLRSRAEVLDRIAALKADAMDPPIAAAEIALLQDLLSLRETPPNALAHLRNLAVDLPALTPAVNRFEARLEAMTAQGIDVDTLDFEASYGRTSMEYYDGFVFGFYADGRPNLPPVATGGRYDALTRVLGRGRELPAVGGVIRPALVLDLGGAS